MRRIIPFASLVASFLAGCGSPNGSVTTGVDGNPLDTKTIDLSIETKIRRRNFEHADSLGVVSLLQVIANPERFHGKRIIVVGFATLQFEGQAIYPTPDAAIEPKNGVWLDYDFGNLPNEPTPLKQMLVEGVFDAKGGGHMGLWTGELCMISRIQYLTRTDVPNQSSDPTLASGTSPAGQETRHP